MSDQVEFAPRVRGIQERQVWEAADALLQEGLRPTIDRVRHKLGTGSPNTVAPMLERWFGTLGKRLDGRALVTPPPGEEVSKLPLNVLQLAEQLWDLSRREADQVQIQKTEATRRELELERNALVQRETELQQRETFFEQARVKVEEALAASKLQFDAMQAQMQSQLQESARMLSNSQAEERRLRKALDEAVASKEALREKAEMELGAKQRAADEAAERYLAHERRLHSEVDRERMATRQAKADLEKEQKARAVDAEASRSALASAKQALQEEKTAHRDAAAVWSRQHQEVQVELATLRERAAGAELRATDLASQLQHQLEQSKREIAQLRESHAATAAALRQLEARGKGEEAPTTGSFQEIVQVSALAAAPSGGAAKARHARVLPSFMRPFVGRAMETQVGVVKARELWAWDRSDLPGPALASEIRAIVVKRRRPTFDELWRTPIQVRLPEDWRRALPDSERLRLARLVETADAVASFPAMTLRDLKDGLALSVADTLGVLAKIEALYWISVPTQSSTSPASQGHADVPVGQEFLDQVRSCLSATWVAELQSDDLRFPHIEGRPLPSWLDPQLGTSRLTSLAHGLCERLIAAHRATWAVELADVALHAIERADKRRPGSEEAKTRWINIFLARYGNGNGQTLQEVGDAHSLTRERVRQICDAILSSITAQSVKMPALERVLAAAGRIMPLSMEEASAQLRRLLGEGPGLGAAMHFAEAVGVASTVQHAELKARTNEGYKLVPMIESIAAPSTWMTAALSFARKDCTFVGCSNFLRIAGYLALNQGIAQDLDTLRTLFEGAPGYRVLDAESGWFTLADSETSAAATRMRKLMSVAGGSAELDTVAAALMTDDRWFYREGGNAMAVPPLHVLSELFGGWEWLNANAHNKYVAKAPIDAESVLSATELGAVKVIERHGGAATRAEIASHLIEALGFSNVAVSATLAMSPALAKLEKSIYSIRGVPVPANGLTQARGRRARERVGLSGSDRPTDQKLDEAAEPRSTPRISSE